MSIMTECSSSHRTATVIRMRRMQTDRDPLLHSPTVVISQMAISFTTEAASWSGARRCLNSTLIICNSGCLSLVWVFKQGKAKNIQAINPYRCFRQLFGKIIKVIDQWRVKWGRLRSSYMQNYQRTKDPEMFVRLAHTGETEPPEGGAAELII